MTHTGAGTSTVSPSGVNWPVCGSIFKSVSRGILVCGNNALAGGGDFEITWLLPHRGRDLQLGHGSLLLVYSEDRDTVASAIRGIEIPARLVDLNLRGSALPCKVGMFSSSESAGD